MASYSKTIRSTLTTVLMLLIGLLVLQSLGYGVGFAIDPEGGVGEFGYEVPPAVDDLTVTLVGLVGVGMLGITALLILSAVLVWRANPAGAHVAMITGGIYVLAGMNAFRAALWWDANFYGITGVSLIVLSAVVRGLQSQERGGGTPLRQER